MSNQMLEMYQSDKNAIQEHTFAMDRHARTMDKHARTMACHCECLAMNAENMWAAIANIDPVYLESHYHERMLKWGLIDKEGKPMI